MQLTNPRASQYLALLNGVRQAAIATDASGRITDWNETATALYGWPADEVIGRNIVDVTPAEISRDEAAAIMERLTSGEVWSGEFRVRSRSGEPFLASVTDVPLLGTRGEIEGILGISDASQNHADLDSAVERLIAACDRLWPRRMSATSHVRHALRVSAGEPHLIQLLSLLTMRYATELDAGTPVELSIEPAAESLLPQFGITPLPTDVYVSIGRHSALHSPLRNARPTGFAASLVRMIGGMLFVGPEATHLFLPTHS